MAQIPSSGINNGQPIQTEHILNVIQTLTGSAVYAVTMSSAQVTVLDVTTQFTSRAEDVSFAGSSINLSSDIAQVDSPVFSISSANTAFTGPVTFTGAGTATFNGPLTASNGTLITSGGLIASSSGNIVGAFKSRAGNNISTLKVETNNGSTGHIIVTSDAMNLSTDGTTQTLRVFPGDESPNTLIITGSKVGLGGVGPNAIDHDFAVTINNGLRLLNGDISIPTDHKLLGTSSFAETASFANAITNLPSSDPRVSGALYVTRSSAPGTNFDGRLLVLQSEGSTPIVPTPGVSGSVTALVQSGAPTGSAALGLVAVPDDTTKGTPSFYITYNNQLYWIAQVTNP